MHPLAGWQNFYVILGSCAGALIGLQFVAISLISDLPVSSGSEDAGHAFATPTIVHFGVALFTAGVMTAPWPSMKSLDIAWGSIGVAGLVYSAIVLRRMLRQDAYRPELEDWIFHLYLPVIAYTAIAASAFAEREHDVQALFTVAASAMLLLFIGIHNAWDAVTYHIFTVRRRHQEKQKAKSTPQPPKPTLD